MSDVDPNTKPLLSLPSLMDLSGKTAVVTGGGRGIGLGIARRLAEAGASVVVLGRDAASAARAAASLGTEPAAHGLGLDVTDETAVTAFIAEVVDRTGRLDIWVNNAGTFPSSPILEQSTREWRDVMAVNLDAVFVASREAGRRMVELGHGGVIINIASVAALKTRVGGSAHYNVSKAGVKMLTEVLALELGPSGVRVLGIAPGLVETPGVTAHEVYSTYFDVLQPLLPLRRTLVPDDVARVALFAASELAASMTGCVLPVESGELLT